MISLYFWGGCSAVSISILALLSHSNLTYADSGSMIVAILLLTKKIENTVIKNITSNILFQLHPNNRTLKVLRMGEWKLADASQIKRGDCVRISAAETIALDGVLECASAEINNHLMSGEARPILLKKGDHVFAGAIAKTDLEISVTGPQGHRKIDAWAETALLAENSKSKYSKIFSKIESSLVVFAFSGAVFIAGCEALRGAQRHQIIESFFVGIFDFLPVSFCDDHSPYETNCTFGTYEMRTDAHQKRCTFRPLQG